jgi:hypothetical protein
MHLLLAQFDCGLLFALTYRGYSNLLGHQITIRAPFGLAAGQMQKCIDLRLIIVILFVEIVGQPMLGRRFNLSAAQVFARLSSKEESDVLCFS